MLKYTWKSLFSGTKIRKLSKKWLAPNQVICSGAKPRYSELPFLFLSAEKSYVRLDTLWNCALHELNTTLSLLLLDIIIFCHWFSFVILSMAGPNMSIHMLVFAFLLLCCKFLRILKLDNTHQPWYISNTNKLKTSELFATKHKISSAVFPTVIQSFLLWTIRYFVLKDRLLWTSCPVTSSSGIMTPISQTRYYSITQLWDIFTINSTLKREISSQILNNLCKISL